MSLGSGCSTSSGSRNRNELVLQRTEEALRRRIGGAVALATHARHHAATVEHPLIHSGLILPIELFRRRLLVYLIGFCCIEIVHRELILILI